MTEPIYATAIHEAGHAVISHLVGRTLMHATVLDQRQGEVVPECSNCETCFSYYRRHNPDEDPHSREIQNNLRCDAAIAVAGELAESLLTDNDQIDPSELAVDRERAGSRISAVHLFMDTPCFGEARWSNNSCELCARYLASLKAAVEALIREPKTTAAIRELAEILVSKRRISGPQIERFLQERSIENGTGYARIPRALTLTDE